jgi:hypothetical protein
LADNTVVASCDATFKFWKLSFCFLRKSYGPRAGSIVSAGNMTAASEWNRICVVTLIYMPPVVFCVGPGGGKKSIFVIVLLRICLIDRADCRHHGPVVASGCLVPAGSDNWLPSIVLFIQEGD